MASALYQVQGAGCKKEARQMAGVWHLPCRPILSR